MSLELSEHDRAWAGRYEREQVRIAAALGPIVVRTEHIGSTAVLGLLAKPVIDILLGIERRDDAPRL